MAEVCYPGAGPPTPVLAMPQLSPLGQGVAGPPPQERVRAPQSPGRQTNQKPIWGAGPGGGGYSPTAMQQNFVCESGLRMKQMGPYVGATAAAMPPPPNESINKTIRDMAGPYQKEAAIRAAEGAIRPWSAYAGLGERRGAQFGDMLAEAARTLNYNQDPTAPSRFLPPNADYATAVAAHAKQVSRAGSGQMHTDGAYSIQGQPARELWAVDLNQPPKYCVACRGGHDPDNEMNPAYEPYTPMMRMVNLLVLESRFQKALLRGELCVTINDSRVEPVRWTWKVKDPEGDEVLAQPKNMSKQDFITQLTLMYDGIRESHEPYRHLATQAAYAFLDTNSPFIVEAVPAIVAPLRLAVQTYEPSLVGHALIMIQKLIKSHPKVCKALVPHMRKLMPAIALMRKHHFVVWLPPPFCTGSAGSFTGHGFAPNIGNRKCRVCGCPLDKEYDSKRKCAAAKKAQMKNPHFLDDTEPKAYERHPAKGRYSKKHLLQDVIRETLDLLVDKGGKQGLAVVMAAVPAYSYCNPKD